MEQADELQLISCAQESMQAFARLYDHYFPIVYAYCLNRLANKETAEDISSQVFLKLLPIIDQFDPKKANSLKPLLFTMAHNLIIDLYRKNSKVINLDETLPVPSENHEPSDLDQELQLSSTQKQIALVLRLINDRYQQIITLKFYAELTTQEIAEIMKVKTAQVAVILFRALESFKKEFKQQFPDTEIYDLI